MIFIMVLAVIATSIIGFVIYNGTEVDYAPNQEIE